MTSEIIAVTHTDFTRLDALLESELAIAIGGHRPHLQELRDRLERAMIIESLEMLPDVVTMNSTFGLRDLRRDESETFTLVYPQEACIAKGNLSILSPLGAEIFGRRVGETFSFGVLLRESRKQVEKLIFQPERVGAFNL